MRPARTGNSRNADPASRRRHRLDGMTG